VFALTAKATVPFPEPEAPCVIVRKLALLVAVQEQVLGVVTEMVAEPPEAGKLVVVVPVMIWQPDGPVELLSLQPAARKRNATTENEASARWKNWQVLMQTVSSTDHSMLRVRRRATRG